MATGNSTGYGPRTRLLFDGDERKYELWEAKFYGYLHTLKLKGELEKNPPNADKNADIYAELIQLLDDRSLALIMRDAKDNGKKALEILREHYMGQGKPKIIALYTELTTLNKGTDESTTDYLIRAEAAAAALKNSGETVGDSLLIAMILKGLPSNFNTFKTVTTQKDPQPTFQQFKVSLRAFEESEHSSVKAESVMKVEAPDIANRDHEIVITFCCMLKHHYSRDEAAFSYGSRSYQSTSLELDEKDFNRHALSSGSSPKDSTQLQAPVSLPSFLPYDKEDIAVFQWVSSQVGVPIDDYDAFRDGILLCKLVNKVSVRKIPEKVISNSSKLERVKLALSFAAHEVGINIRLEPNDVINGKERVALRGYICLLKRIKSKQDQLMTRQLRSLDRYSDLVDSIGFSRKASQRPSVANLREPVHDDLCKSISKSALYKKLAHSRSMQLGGTSNDAFLREAVNPYSMKRNESALGENFGYSRNTNENANGRWRH